MRAPRYLRSSSDRLIFTGARSRYKKTVVEVLFGRIKLNNGTETWNQAGHAGESIIDAVIRLHGKPLAQDAHGLAHRE